MTTFFCAVLLFACMIILGVQIMIIRQIGMLQSRLRPENMLTKKPKHTSEREIVFLNGERVTFADQHLTACIFLSTTCYVCRPVLERIGSSMRSLNLNVALASADSGSLDRICSEYDLPQDKVFYGDKLQNDLQVFELPALIVLNSHGDVVVRSFVDGIESIRQQIAQINVGEGKASAPSSLKEGIYEPTGTV